jgi:predicted dehydrogenase
MKAKTSRRDFLKQTSLAGVGFWVAGGLSLADSKSPNEKLNIACIGVGGKGSSDTDQAAQCGNIVALCDIDDNTLNAKAEETTKDKKAKKFPHAKKYNDFRKMLEEMDKQIDAVTVSTPDHTHAPASIMAMKMGKHVYCQKPLTHDVYEARMMKEIAAKHKVATQMGNQGTAENGLRHAVEIIQAGGIGPVSEAHVWTNRPIWPQAPDVVARPDNSPAVPKHVHWDLFLGPAPERPYALYPPNDKGEIKGAYHPFHWRGWWDFGTGALGDMACHTANMPFMALKLQYPSSVSAESGPINPETYPGWATVTWEFPARGDMPPVKLVWYEGHRDGVLNLPPPDLLKGQKAKGSGALLIGSKGTLYSPDDYGAEFMLLPKENFEGYKVPAQTLPRNGGGDLGMKREWVAAIKGGPGALSNFDYASLLAETVLLGNVAIRLGKKLEWDGPGLKVTNCPEAAQYIRREYRSGWTL